VVYIGLVNNADPLLGRLDQFLAGVSDELLLFIEESLFRRQGVCSFLARFWQQDLDRLRDFYRFGPQRNRQLSAQLGLGHSVIGQAELDDLLVLNRKTSRTVSGQSAQ
jgi:hypothetical protein